MELMEEPDSFEHMLVPEAYGGSIYILLVEDSVQDAELFTESMRGAKVSNIIEYVHSGDEAWARLQNNKKRVPDWIPIDLTLEGSVITGDELITKISEDSRFKKSRIMILSGMVLSDEQRERYKKMNNVDFFFLKPLRFENIQDMIRLTSEKIYFDIYKKHEVA